VPENHSSQFYMPGAVYAPIVNQKKRFPTLEGAFYAILVEWLLRRSSNHRRPEFISLNLVYTAQGRSY